MSVEGNILTQDLARMVNSGKTGQPLSQNDAVRGVQLAVASHMTSEDYAEAKFKLSHGGKSRAEWKALHDARDLEEQQAQAEAAMRAPYLAAIPADIKADSELIGARAELSRFNAWVAATQADLSELMVARGRLLTMIDAPKHIGASVGDKIAGMAKSLLSSLGLDRGADVADAVELERERIELEQTAEAARQALPEIEGRIAIKQMHVETLEVRRGEFIDPILGELLEASGIHPRIEKLRTELAALEKLANDFGGERGDYGSQPHQGIWKEFADKLANDPRAKCEVKLLAKAGLLN
jgi:hypothetical protein